MISVPREKVNLISKYLKNGCIVALPTETVYGLAVKYDDIGAIKKLVDLKERGTSPFTLMIYDKNDICKYCIVNSTAQKIINSLFPGPLTIVLPKNRDFNNNYFNNMDTIGIRIPDYKFMLELLKETGPLIVTSANLKGEIPCINCQEVIERVPFADVVVEGESGKRKPSTVISIKGTSIELIREGELSIEYIRSIK